MRGALPYAPLIATNFCGGTFECYLRLLKIEHHGIVIVSEFRVSEQECFVDYYAVVTAGGTFEKALILGLAVVNQDLSAAAVNRDLGDAAASQDLVLAAQHRQTKFLIADPIGTQPFWNVFHNVFHCISLLKS